jgi:hypothetical protein
VHVQPVLRDVQRLLPRAPARGSVEAVMQQVAEWLVDDPVAARGSAAPGSHFLEHVTPAR